MGFYPRDFYPPWFFPDEFFPGDTGAEPPATENFWPNGFFANAFYPDGFFPGENTAGDVRLDLAAYSATVELSDIFGTPVWLEPDSVSLDFEPYRATVTASSIVNAPDDALRLDIEAYRASIVSSNVQVFAAVTSLDASVPRGFITSRVSVYPATISFDISHDRQEVFVSPRTTVADFDVETYRAEVEGVSQLWEHQREAVTAWEQA